MKKNLGCDFLFFFVGDIMSGIGFNHFWLTLLGPALQLQEGSISLKF